MIFFGAGEKGPAAQRKLVPLLPLRDIVVFPHMVVPLFVGREKSIRALEEAMNQDKMILLAAQRNAKINDPKAEEIHATGTLSQVVQMLRLPDGTVKVLVEGKQRARTQKFEPGEDYFLVEVEEVIDKVVMTPELEALMRSANATFESYVKLNKKVPPEMIVPVASIQDPSRLGDTIAAHLTLKLEDKQPILEVDDVTQRLEKLVNIMQSEIEILQIEKKIKTRVKKQMERNQKEYYLTEQMRAIQKELGERDDFRSELKELEDKIKKTKLSDEARDKANKEVKKLKTMSPMSAEGTVVRNYLDWLLSLPWQEYSEEKNDITAAEKILEEDHYGLEKPKERIVEYLAVQTLVKKMKAPILCFVGAPGVGKTSLGKSIARATGRNFVRVSLGGVRDEAEIRGHRRTYIGALPGKIIQSMKKAKKNNPVFLLDEVDKMSMDFRGDPSAALLEVLDPEQNHAFNDHYLDVDYDLSRVMFITTANTTYTIPPALQDRMEIIRLPGYIEPEKVQIAAKFLISKQLEAHGLADKKVSFSENGILTIIRLYTREAGVRNLEREIATICRKIAKEKVKSGSTKPIMLAANSVSKYLGVPKYRYSETEKENQVGLANGLAWTEVGGELLVTEATVMPGKGKLIITGKLGEVMQESAQAALSYVRSRAESLGLEKDFYQKVDVHVHIPEGAIPKDGPSAGITMAVAITSALIRKPVRSEVALTGEITLRGRVLPIGGLKEKIVAAHRGKVKLVIIPKDNEKDLADIPAHILKALEVAPVEHMDEVLVKTLAVDNPEEIFSPPAPRTQEVAARPAEEVTTTH
jgi:ATP-dependent Lon protease